MSFAPGDFSMEVLGRPFGVPDPAQLQQMGETEAQREKRTCPRPTSGIDVTLTHASESSRLSLYFFFGCLCP